MSEEILGYAVGDIGPDREEPRSIFDHVAGFFEQGDIVFGQLEAILSQRRIPVPHKRGACRAQPELAGVLKDVGFDVISFASNHCMDLGQEAFLETLHHLNSEGLRVIGAGENISEARKPAIFECKGTKVAFLGYNSILPQGFWATEDKPGCTPMRALTLYEQIELDQPGTPSRIHTYPHRDDLHELLNDIKKAKAQADLVILSIHWGIHFIPAVLADYQRDVAHAAIEAGVDLILGHHAHILKGIEVYKGKVIFYSLSNFALELNLPEKARNSEGHKHMQKLHPDWHDPEYPSFPFPPDSRKTIIAKFIISEKQVKTVSFVPALINKQAQPEILNPIDQRFDEIVKYLDEISKSQGLDTKYVVQGSEVIVQP